MEYCSPLWDGAPASHLSRLPAVETKAFRIIGISPNEAESLGLSLSHRRQVNGLSVFYRFLSGLVPPVLSAICPVPHISAGSTRSAINLLLVKLPKSRITAHRHSLIPLFPTSGTNSHTLFNPTLPSRSSKQLFTTTSYLHHPNSRSFLPPLIHRKPTSFKFPAFLPQSPEVSLLFTPCTLPLPSPFHRSPNVPVPDCFVLPSSAPLVP